MSKVYEKPISQSTLEWVERLKVHAHAVPVKYPGIAFVILPVFIWTALEHLGLSTWMSILLALPYPLLQGSRLYLWSQIQESPRPVVYEYDEGMPIYIRYGTAILLSSFALIGISVFVILPKTVVGGVAVIILAGTAVWKTATDGRAFHKNMQERCGVEKLDSSAPNDNS